MTSDQDQLATLINRITYNSKQRSEIFTALSTPQQSVVMRQLSPSVQQSLLEALPIETVVDLLDHLDLRHAQQVLNRIPTTSRRKKIIQRLKNERHQKIEQFVQFHSKTTSSLLHLHYLFVPNSLTVKEVAELLEDYIDTTGKIPEVLLEDNGILQGEVALSALVRAANHTQLHTLTRPVDTLVYTQAPAETLAYVQQHPNTKVVVLDSDDSVLGIMYTDDVLNIIGSAPASSLFTFAGVEASERPFDSTYHKVQHRYKWLILNLATAFLAASVIALFEDTLASVVILAMYMPIIAGMGSNAATQTLAVVVRGIAIGEITLANSRPALWREIQAGFINGTITGSLVFLIALIFNDDLWLGLVAGLSVLASLVIAAITGTLVPLTLRRLGKDPATSATIFITTGIDVLGFFIFFGLATLLLL